MFFKNRIGCTKLKSKLYKNNVNILRSYKSSLFLFLLPKPSSIFTTESIKDVKNKTILNYTHNHVFGDFLKISFFNVIDKRESVIGYLQQCFH